MLIVLPSGQATPPLWRPSGEPLHSRMSRAALLDLNI